MAAESGNGAPAIDGRTRLYGVMGTPLDHSLSPLMHNAAFSAARLNAVYLAFDAPDAEGCVRAMRSLHVRGMSVTIPHKAAVMPFLDSVDKTARRIGAVNTIVNQGGRLHGTNTDGIGALRALEKHIHLAGKSCLVVGAGGAARAVGFSVRERGARVAVACRSSRKGKILARALGGDFVSLREMDRIQPDVVIQTTPVGMHPHPDANLVHPDMLSPGMTVMDVVYNPAETRLLAAARSAGCLAIGGAAMFVYQGAEQYRTWTGMEPPLEVMWAAVHGVLEKTP